MSETESTPELHILAEIREAIGSQQLPPGTRLREDEMRQIFGVSRSRIRKVFARLAYDGLVTLEPNRGASVSRPTPKEARDLFAARRSVEAGIVAAAIENLSRADVERLSSHILREREAERIRDRDAMIRLSGEFHLLLAELAGNAILEKFLRELVTRESLIIQIYERPGQPSCSCDEHADIISALATGQAGEAMVRMKAHLSSIESRLNLEGADRPRIVLRDIFGGSARQDAE